MKNHFQKNFLNIFLAGLGFTFSCFFFLYYVRVQLKNYINQIGSYLGELPPVIQGLNQGSLTPFDAQPFVDTLQSLTTKALVLGFVITPLALFVFFVVFQSIIFKYLKDGNLKHFKQYFWRFTLASFVTWVLAFVLLAPILSNAQMLVSNFQPWMLILVFLLVILDYFSLILFAALTRKFGWSHIVKVFKLGIKQWKKFVPIILGFFFVSLLFLGFFSALFTNFNLDAEVAFPSFGNVITLVFLLMILLWFKNLIVEKVRNYW